MPRHTRQTAAEDVMEAYVRLRQFQAYSRAQRRRLRLHASIASLTVMADKKSLCLSKNHKPL